MTEVDQRVVEMRFNNANFEKNARKSGRTVDRLMEKLKFKGAEKGFERIDKAAEQVSFTGMTRGLDEVSEKFSATAVVATTALVRVTNQALATGERLVKSLSVDQIVSGWEKYNEKTANVQTIMNATGKSIDRVNGYLAQLMWYSDETSYSFAEMTSALSQMTAAGGDIEKMIPMIMGIANATADAGKTGFAFQSTIRNLTQSYSAGHLQLQDWKSLNLMGTATSTLKEELIATAKELGKLDETGRDASGHLVSLGTFESTLADKWADKEVMEKTFERYAAMMQDAYELTEKYDITASEALEQLSGKYGEVAERSAKAAQQAKSFKDAIDATKDAVSTGWMKSFELLIGGYDEAVNTWTELSERLWDIFASGGEKRNKRLSEGLNSGWQQMTSELGGAAEGYEYILQKLALQNGVVTEEDVQNAGSFSAALRKSGVSAEVLYRALEKAKHDADELNALTDEELDARGLDTETVREYAGLFEGLNKQIEDGALDLSGFADQMDKVSGREHLVQSVWNLFDAFGNVLGPVKEGFEEVFPAMGGESIYQLCERLDELTGKLVVTDETSAKIKATFKGLFRVVRMVTDAAWSGFKMAGRVLEPFVEVAGAAGSVLLDVSAGLGEFIDGLAEAVSGTKPLSEKLNGLWGAAKKLLNPLDALSDRLRETKLGGFLADLITDGSVAESALGRVFAMAGTTWNKLGELGTGVTNGDLNVVNALGEVLTWVGDALGHLLEEATDAPRTISKGIQNVAGAVQSGAATIKSATSGAWEPLERFAAALRMDLGDIDDADIYRLLSLVDIGLVAVALNQFAKALKGIKAVVQTSLDKLLTAVSGSFNALSKSMKVWQKEQYSKILLNMAAAVAVLAGAMWVMGQIDPAQFMTIAGVTMTLVVILALAAKQLAPTMAILGKSLDALRAELLRTGTLWGMAANMAALGVAFGMMASGIAKVAEVVTDGDVAANVMAICSVLGAMAVVIVSLMRSAAMLSGDQAVVALKLVWQMGKAMVAFGAAAAAMGYAVKMMGEIPSEAMNNGLVGLYSVMIALGALGAAMNRWGLGLSWTMGASMIGFAAAAVELVAALQLMNNIPLDRLFLLWGMMSGFLIEFAAIGGVTRQGLGTAAAMLAIGASITTLAGAMAALALVPAEALDKGSAYITTLLALMAALSVALRILGGRAEAARAVLSVSGGLLICATALVLLSQCNLIQMTIALKEMVDALGVLTGTVALLSYLEHSAESGAQALLTISKGLLAVAAATVVFGYVKWENIGTMTDVVVRMVSALAIGSILSTMFNLSKGMKAIASAINTFCSGALKLAGAMAIFGIFSYFAEPICDAIVAATPDITEALVAMVTGLCDVIVLCAEPLAEALTALCIILFETIVGLTLYLWEKIQPALNDLWSKVTNFFDGKAGELAASFWNALKDALNPMKQFTWTNPFGWLVDELENGTSVTAGIYQSFKRIGSDIGTELVEGIQNGEWANPFGWLVDELENGTSVNAGIYQSFKRLGSDAGTGLVDGIQNGEGDVYAAGAELGAEVIAGYKDATETHSPSRVMKQNGIYLAEGLALGLHDRAGLASVEGAMRDMAEGTRRVFTDYWKIHSPSQVAASDAENILEGAALGMADPEKRAQLRNAAEEATLEEAKGVASGVEKAKEMLAGAYDKVRTTLSENGLTFPKIGGSLMTGLTVDFGTNWLEDLMKKTTDDLVEEAESTGTGTGKTVAETIASEYEKQLKANKYLQDWAEKEDTLWDLTDGGAVTNEELTAKKAEVAAKKIELQTERVRIAQEQYDRLTQRAGKDDDKTRAAYSTLLDEEAALEKLRQSRHDDTYEALLERYEQDAKVAEAEYTLWSEMHGDAADLNEKAAQKLTLVNEELKMEAEKAAIAEQKYAELKADEHAASELVQKAQLEMLEAQTEYEKKRNELEQVELDRLEEQIARYEKQEQLAQTRQSLMAKLYDDGSLSERASAYEEAVRLYGEGSQQAMAASMTGTMSAVVGVSTAVENMAWSLKKLAGYQHTYDKTVEASGKNSDAALDALSDVRSEEAQIVALAGELGEALDLSDSGKKAMTQLGYTLAKNWKPIQNGLEKALKQVEKRSPELYASMKNVLGTAMSEGAAEVGASFLQTVAAAMSGDYATAVVAGMNTLLTFMNSEFGAAVTKGMKKIFAQTAKSAVETKALAEGVTTVAEATGEVAKSSGGVSKVLGGMGKIGTVLAGLGGGIGETLSGVLAKVVSMFGAKGLVVAALIAVAGIVIANFDKLKEWFTHFMSWLKEKVTGLVKGIWTVGKNIGTGLWNGIKSVAGTVWNGVKSIGSGILNGFKSILGIHSPSKETFKIGQFTGEGLVNGMTSCAASVAKGTTALGGGILDGLTGTLGSAGDGFDEFAQNAALAGLTAAEMISEAAQRGLDDGLTLRAAMDMSEVYQALDSTDDWKWLDPGRVVSRTSMLADSVEQTDLRRRSPRPERDEMGKKKTADEDVVSAVAALGERVDRAVDAVRQMKLVINRDKLVGEIAAPMNEKLGQIAGKNKR